MDTGIEGKKALVLASSDGLGFATGKELLAEGATVMFTSRDKARVAAATEPLVSAYGDERVLTGEVDVADPQSLAALFEHAKATLGRLDLLVCNAGGPPPGTFETTGDDKWELAFNLTLMSVVR
ncbi:MAG: SDR family NAD(P)-dependent oxidoreductase, partial [bacterium]